MISTAAASFPIQTLTELQLTREPGPGDLQCFWELERESVKSIVFGLYSPEIGGADLVRLHSVLNHGGESLEFGSNLGDAIYIATGLLKLMEEENLRVITWEVGLSLTCLSLTFCLCLLNGHQSFI